MLRSVVRARPADPAPVAATRRWTPSGATMDVSIALIFFTMMALGVVAYTPLIDDAPPVAAGVALAAAMTAPLAWRRQAPRTVLAIVVIAFTIFRVLKSPEWSISSLTLFVSLYTVGAELPPERSRTPRAIALVTLASLIVYGFFVMFDPESIEVTGRDLFTLQVAEIGLNVLFGAAAWVLGDIAWRRRTAEAELAERVAELAANRQALARQAVQEERVRIARELHDVVAHHVSVMGIQAGAARRSIERDPVRASEALSSVEQSSRDAVREMQRLLHFLRSEDDPAHSDAPQPTLTDLQELVTSVRDAGLEVTVEVNGDERPLPSSVELSAYRIVQEALTNTLKHSRGATRSSVRLDYLDDRLRLEVRDDGTAAERTDPSSDGGRGLVGMRERAALHGGTLDAGARPGGGFQVAGWLPLTGTDVERAEAPA